MVLLAGRRTWPSRRRTRSSLILRAPVFAGNPGALVSPDYAKRFAESLMHCHVVQLGSGLHYLQEDHPDPIGHAIAGWIAGIEAATAGAGLPRAA